MEVILRLLLFTFAFCFCDTLLPAQLGGWSHRMPVQVFEEKGQNTLSTPVMLIVDTQTLVSAGLMEIDGRDIRFADSCGSNLLPYWIESDMNTDSTRIWVRIPAILANDSATHYLFHGASTAAPASSFNSVFQTTFSTTGNQTLGGPQVVESFEVFAGDTLFIQPGVKLTVFARRVRIEGVVMGNGAGHAAPSLSQAGNGPGGGGTSFNAGSGGGGHGGNGGLGGYDFADSPGAGGLAYGTAYGPDAEMGSSGGSSGSRLGGAGGGSLAIYSESILVAGKIKCNGLSGQQPGSTRGGGGGAGGGILLKGKYLDITGSLEVNGGNGSVGILVGNDDGGGGAGGRIKLFWEKSFHEQAQILFAGGIGGPNGSVSGGENGFPGTSIDSLQAFPSIAFVNNPSTVSPLPLNPDLDPIPNPTCPGEPIAFALPQGYSNYAFFTNGVISQNSSSSTWNPGVVTDGTQLLVEATYGACNIMDTLVVQAAPTSFVHITASDSTACIGDTVLLDVGSGWNSVTWSNGDTTQISPVTFSGFIDVVVTDGNNCPARDTFVVNLAPPPIPQITSNGLPACEGSPVTLSTGQFSAYTWSNGGTSQSTVITASDTYTVTVTGPNGCSNTASIPIALDTLPTPTVVWQSNVLFTQTGYTSYQWFLNGVALSGAIFSSYIPTFNGSYMVVVTNSKGCKGSSDTTQIIVGINDTDWSPEISIFPNPTAGKVYLEGQLSHAQVVQVRTWDVLGKVVWEKSWDLQSGSYRLSMDLERLSSGYFVVEISGKGAGDWVVRRRVALK